MPQLTLEYSDNLDFDVRSVLLRLNHALAATGAIQLKGIKSRAIRHSEYCIADGNPEYAFVHVDLAIKASRALPVQQDISARVLAVLKDVFGARFQTGYLALSVDLKELRDEVYLSEHNIPATPPG